MIKRIKIEGYKSFRRLDLKLSPVSVIFGPNASGKSNLLDAIQLLSRMATCKTLGEAFEGHRGTPLESFYYGDVGFEKMLKKDRLKMSFEVDVELSDKLIEDLKFRLMHFKSESDLAKPRVLNRLVHRHLRYGMSVAASLPMGQMHLLSRGLLAIRPNGSRKKGVLPILEHTADKGHHSISMSGDGISVTTGASGDLWPAGGLEIPPSSDTFVPQFAVFQEELEQWRSYRFDPEAVREATHIEHVEQVGSRGERLAAFLNVLEHENPRAFENFNLTLTLALPVDEARIDVVRQEPGVLTLRLVEDGIWYPMRLVSDGTLRLIGLIAALHPDAPATVICYEEPENGVHPMRMKIIADMIKNVAEYYGKQIILTTHSPLFAECFADDQLFVCRKQDGQSTIEPFKPIGDIYREHEIERALQDRIPRGDFGG